MSAGRAGGRTVQPAWWDQGEDPDYRYSLANERTSLAWIRTALALIAGGVAALEFLPTDREWWARVVGVSLAGAGGVAAVLAYLRWASNERAMRLRSRLRYGPLTVTLVVLAVVLGSVAGLVTILVLAF